MEQGIEFLKGHGTENDFIVLPDPDGSGWPEDRLTPELVRRLCERRGATPDDGVAQERATGRPQGARDPGPGPGERSVGASAGQEQGGGTGREARDGSGGHGCQPVRDENEPSVKPSRSPATPAPAGAAACEKPAVSKYDPPAE